MNVKLKILFFAFLLLNNYQLLIAKDFQITDNSQLVSDIAQADTNQNSNVTDTLKPKLLDDFVSKTPISKKKYEMAKSPTTAVILSLLLPGAGQFYNESYWKAPLFLGGTGVLAYLIIDNHIKFKDEQKIFDEMDDIDVNKSRQKIIKEYYRDQRDQDVFYLTGVYILAAIDSYVGAHLYDFNVSDDLSLKLQPLYSNGFRVGITLSW